MATGSYCQENSATLALFRPQNVMCFKLDKSSNSAPDQYDVLKRGGHWARKVEQFPETVRVASTTISVRRGPRPSPWADRPISDRRPTFLRLVGTSHPRPGVSPKCVSPTGDHSCCGAVGSVGGSGSVPTPRRQLSGRARNSRASPEVTTWERADQQHGDFGAGRVPRQRG